ncbi:C-type lectin domain family 2 member E-like isoform X3 [Mesocricetus auratus]|uniref:C-type lectin domain family 2 member E-like isoform X3 n=1 Tax=Mesocricetus auratus TaxID=10036 RepID=A0ABM2XFK0_MESAU|nr:C-type lectin domain family 2 member E-like isoform X3 [Mesocricetus auratus]
MNTEEAPKASMRALKTEAPSTDLLQEGEMVRPVTERCEPCYATCPRDWIGFRSKCFYFSEDMINWTFSQTSCMALEAQLVLFDSLEELNFLKRCKGASDHWIGLHRESPEHPWMWTDNTGYNNLVPTQGAGECAYLSDRGISSGRDYTHRKWICSKFSNYTLQCPETSTVKSRVKNVSKHL